MKSIEKSARTQEEAIQAALEELNASITDVEVKVLDEGSKGLFGLFGSRLARVLVTLKTSDMEEELDAMVSDTSVSQPVAEPKVAKKPAAAAEPAAAPAPKVQPVQDADEAEEEESLPAAKPAVRKPEPVRRTRQPQKEKPKSEPQNVKETPKESIQLLEKPEVTMIEDDQVDPLSPAGKAMAFLDELTKLMGVSVTIHVGTDAEGNVYGKIEGDTLGVLIGRRGETLDALQYLTSLKVNRNQETYTRVTLDTENYRERREDTLIRLANRMANRAVKTGRRVSLEPMNPYERRIIHSALQSNDAVDTHSEGEEPNRHVVITLKR